MIDAMTRRHIELRRMHESYAKERRQSDFWSHFTTMLSESAKSSNGIAGTFSIRRLFEEFVPDGREAIRFMQPSNQGGYVSLQESAANVDTSMFANIIGQIMFTSILDAYNSPDFIGDQLVTTEATMFNGEKIPGITHLGDVAEQINEGRDYPTATFSEEFVETPETIKRGLIVNLTKEAIFFDKTGRVVSEAASVGTSVALSKEKRILDAVCGISTIYRRNGAAAEATYQSDNTATSTSLVDWTSIDTSQQKFNVQTDPNTGEPIMIQPNVLLVPKALQVTANRIVTASMVRVGTNTAANQTYTNGNQLQSDLAVVSGAYVRQRTSSDTTWFYGAPKQAFRYMENWPIKVEQSAGDSEVGFTRDIVMRFKASERGAVAVRDRRYMNKNTA